MSSSSSVFISEKPQTKGRKTARCRAAKACRRCNEKRVKCDASEKGLPCSRCKDRNEPDCRLIQSRRGIYVRKPRKPQADIVASATRGAEAHVEGDDEPNPQQSEDLHLYTPSEPPVSETAPESISAIGSQTQRPYRRTRSQSTGRLKRINSRTFDLTRPTAVAINDGTGTWKRSSMLEEHGQQGSPCPEADNRPVSTSERPSSDTGSDPSGSALSTPETEPLEQDTSSRNTDVSAQSLAYRDISWGGMIGPLFEGQKKGEDVVDKCSITYLGESFPLAMVLKDLCGNAQPRLHHPGPPCPQNEDVNSTEAHSIHHPPYMGAEEIEFLQAKKAFEAPSCETFDALVDVFLERVFPIYPIVNKQEFLQQHRSRRIPWILLHALCFLSVTFCPSSVLHRAGFETRREARWLYYSKAKALFDVGYEGNKIIVLQVSIMMSFWGGGPNNYWNFYSWISTGVTIAEGLGCHRSMAGTNMKPQDRSLLKRLWWVLVIRDTTCAALVGRPFRVNLDQSDAEPLTVEDFMHDGASADVLAMAGPSSSSSSLAAPATSRFDLYQIEMTKLILILRDIIVARFYPIRRQSSTATSALQQQTPMVLLRALQEWRAQLPRELEWSQDSAHYTNVFASTLSILYNHHLILTHLPYPVDRIQNIHQQKQQTQHRTMPQDQAEHSQQQQQMDDEVASAAAQQIAAAACVVTTKSDLLLAPHELFHGIFMAAVKFYMQTKSQRRLVAQLGLSGLSNCQMLFHESRDFWDPSPWITQLFDKVLCATAQGSTESSSNNSVAENNSDKSNGIQNGMLSSANNASNDVYLDDVYSSTMNLHGSQGPGMASFVNNAPVTATGATAFDNAICATGYDLWQSHLVLGNLFDVQSCSLVPVTPNFDDRPVSTPWFDAP